MNKQFRFIQRKFWALFKFRYWFVLSRNKLLKSANDLLIAPKQSCISKIIFCLNNFLLSNNTWLVITDDDALLHPFRVQDDLKIIYRHFANVPVLYGQIGWAAGWKSNHHYGYGNNVFAFEDLAQKWNEHKSLQGPFLWPYGMFMTLNKKLVQKLVTTSRFNNLSKLPDFKGSKCKPPTDTSLGYMIADLDFIPLIVDASGSERIHFWPNRMTNHSAQHELLVLHGVKTEKMAQMFVSMLKIPREYELYRDRLQCRYFNPYSRCKVKCRPLFDRYIGANYCWFMPPYAKRVPYLVE